MTIGVEKKPVVNLNPLQEFTVSQAIQITNRIIMGAKGNNDLLLMAQRSRIGELIELGLYPQQVEQLIDVALPTSTREKDAIHKSKTSGTIFKATQIEKLPKTKVAPSV